MNTPGAEWKGLRPVGWAPPAGLKVTPVQYFDKRADPSVVDRLMDEVVHKPVKTVTPVTPAVTESVTPDQTRNATRQARWRERKRAKDAADARARGER